MDLFLEADAPHRGLLPESRHHIDRIERWGESLEHSSDARGWNVEPEGALEAGGYGIETWLSGRAEVEAQGSNGNGLAVEGERAFGESVNAHHSPHRGSHSPLCPNGFMHLMVNRR